MATYFVDRISVGASSTVRIVAADTNEDRDIYLQGASGGIGFTQAQAGTEPGIAPSEVTNVGHPLLLPADEELWFFNPAGASVEVIVLVTKARGV